MVVIVIQPARDGANPCRLRHEILPVVAVESRISQRFERGFVPQYDDGGVVLNTPNTNHTTARAFLKNGFSSRGISCTQHLIVCVGEHGLHCYDELEDLLGAATKVMLAPWNPEQDEVRLGDVVDELKREVQCA